MRDEKVIFRGAVVRSKASNLHILNDSVNFRCIGSLQSLERVQRLVLGGEENLAVGENGAAFTLDGNGKLLNL